MSSLNATQADGYYVPPEYYSSGTYKKKSINQFQKSKGHNQYLERGVVRFELPYDGFCELCESHVGKGTRFNAHKKHVDDYYTTKIWEFTMTCRVCVSSEKKQTFVIRTNPKERCFDYTSGIRKKQEDFDTKEAQSLGYIDTDQTDGKNVILTHSNDNMNHESNALDGLAKEAMGQRKAMTERDALQFLLDQNNVTKRLDSDSNSQLRGIYRKERKAKKKRLQNAASLGLGYGIELLDHNDGKTTSTVIPKSTRDAIRHRHAKQNEQKSFSKLNSIFSNYSKKSKRRNSNKLQNSSNYVQFSEHNSTNNTNIDSLGVKDKKMTKRIVEISNPQLLPNSSRNTVVPRLIISCSNDMKEMQTKEISSTQKNGNHNIKNIIPPILPDYSSDSE